MGCVRASPASSLPVFVLVVYVLSLAVEVDPCYSLVFILLGSWLTLFLAT